ncbi:MAG TPA: sigma 54-interacting transcriptional regulator [Candidatus Sulfotelmatobacter sp.]|nr:sigma 54-interacting transcriptional regulator [Candidatus Sulfotelmatobacter sp.]
MNPRLAAINGPLRDSVFPLKDGSLTIGREISNQLILDDSLVALQHCKLTCDAAGACVVSDLGSASGTFVNGLPVTERTLVAGDQIVVGGSVFVFHSEEAKENESGTIVLSETAKAVSEAAAKTRLRGVDVRYLQPDALAALPSGERTARDLQTLVKISTAIGSIRDVESLQWQLLGMIFDVVPAERGAILVGSDPEEFSSVVAWDRVAGPQHAVPVDRELARQVLEEGVAILSNEKNGGVAASVSASEPEPKQGEAEKPAVHSLMCVPLLNLDKAIGLIYLDTTNPTARFTNEDLQLVTAIAGIASMALESARQVEWLGSENQRLRAEVDLDHDMVGDSAAMRDVYQLIERVASTDSTVLVYGESGTGKELCARAIHRNSPRRDQPFVAINCAALTETLLESELFGHERGAFTGAVTQKRGQLEMANAGTIFLDEMGEISPALQSKLLRVLQERDFMRVGGTRSIPLNIRVIAATNKNLLTATREGTFREDLYYRLNVVAITMPPLRDRKEDIPQLANYFGAKYAEKCNRRIMGISADAGTLLKQYDWPGNIRELENAIERAVVLGSSGMILPEDLPEALHETPAQSMRSSTYHEAVRQLKRQLILTAMDQSEGKITEAARLLGVHSNYLHRLIRNLDLRLTLKKRNQG